MPFRSRAQQRFAFGTHQPWAKRWAKQTDFAGLPEHKDAGTDAGAMAHGPGGLLSTPGLGSARKRKGRKWGMRMKDYSARAGQTIQGNLGRAQNGKFTRVGAPSSDAPPAFGRGAKKPKKARGRKGPAKPKQTPEQRAQATAAKRAQNAAAVAKRMADTDTGLAPGGSAALLAFAQGTKPDAQTGASLAQLGLAEQAQDGSYRMTPTGHAAVAAMQAGDYQRAVDAISRGTDASGKRTQRQQERAQRQQASAAKRQASEAARQARQQAVAARRVAAAAKKKPASGGGGSAKKPTAAPAPAAPHAAAPAKRRATHSGGSSSGGGGGGGGSSAKPKAPTKIAKPTISPALRDAASALSEGSNVTDAQIQQLVTNGLVKLDRDGKPILTAAGLRVTMKTAPFVVFKDHAGRDRWIARTTTAYRDRDGEIISEAALDSDSQRMTATKQFGPLRWWHVGEPDPGDPVAPWGPGLDIGDCDFSTVIGRTRVESGTFRDSAIARKVAAVADELEMSPGFFHPLDQPDTAGVFHTIRTFERSNVPIRYSRASNLFTGFTVKEFRMDITEMERRFKAMIGELKLTPEAAESLAAGLVATEKAAVTQGIAFKEADPAYPDLEINGVVYKAFPPKAADAAAPEMPVADTKAPMDMADAEPDMSDPNEGMEGEAEGDYIGDMAVGDFQAMLAETLAPLIKALDISSKMDSQIGELKSMLGGVATKDAGTAAEIASLKARLAQIEGDQPATILPDEVAAALKGAPEQAKAPEHPAIDSTPERPWRGWAAKSFPELYQNGENA